MLNKSNWSLEQDISQTVQGIFNLHHGNYWAKLPGSYSMKRLKFSKRAKDVFVKNDPKKAKACIKAIGEETIWDVSCCYRKGGKCINHCETNKVWWHS